MWIAVSNGMPAKKEEDLAEAVSHLLEECRMVLPGVQALFGFQLVAVFNQRFAELPFGDQVLHLTAVASVALSAALVMTPAAFHREVEPHGVSERLLRISTWLLLASMACLALGIAADFFIIAYLVLENRVMPGLAAALLLVMLVLLWFVFPFWNRRQPG
jgi:hypothetical protein